MFAVRTSLRRIAPSAPRGAVARNQAVRRIQTTPSLNAAKETAKETAKDASASPLIAGAVGGSVALVGVYAWYHLSGTSKVIAAARRTLEAAESAKKTVATHTPSRGEVVVFLRSNLAPYLAFIPGASVAFDEIDAIADTHGDELNAILFDAYGDLKDLLENGGLDKQTAMAIADLAKRVAADLKDLSMDIGDKILEDNPQLKDKIGGGIHKLKDLGRQYGPEAQKIVDETYKQVEGLVKEGLSPSGIAKVTKLVNEKTKQIEEMGRKAAEKAWEEGSQQVKKYLDKAPQVKKLVEENLDSIKEAALSGGISVSAIPQIFQRIKDAATGGDNKEAIDRLKRYLEDLAKKGKEQGTEHWHSVARLTRDYVKSFPWGEQALNEMPDLNELVVTVQSRGPEAEELARETAKEIAEVLKRRMEEAKKLGQATKEEAKEKSKE
ncbi:hypothetical protein FN846DRAFT_908445 [Sphaerosporella brunnea]|uniref:Uncharacterized protein n=1 Tax=Sphaerosporella brunnea TaxID=1250544 RepID=A0A5J5ETL3_9PEZI|nr:hypothetical protein FN846DRAFT_908445 [Sphaerosporella brunnea]